MIGDLRYRKMAKSDVPLLIGWIPREDWVKDQVLIEINGFFDLTKPAGLVAMLGDEIVGSVLTLFVHAWVAEELIASKNPFPNPKLLRWASEGRNPFLSAQQLAVANATTGLVLLPVGLSWSPRLSEELAAQVRVGILIEYAERYVGYRVNRIICETMNELLASGCVDQGYRAVNLYEDWLSQNWDPNQTNRPILFVADPADAYGRVNSFLTQFFAYQAPKIRFSEGHKEVLELAMTGTRDEAIADALHIGFDALKARWRELYIRVDDALPGFLPQGAAAGRGQEKRRHLLAYLERHREELAPYDWKVSQKWKK
jgi:hypothetical protein